MYCSPVANSTIPYLNQFPACGGELSSGILVSVIDGNQRGFSDNLIAARGIFFHIRKALEMIWNATIQIRTTEKLDAGILWSKIEYGVKMATPKDRMIIISIALLYFLISFGPKVFPFAVTYSSPIFSERLRSKKIRRTTGAIIRKAQKPASIDLKNRIAQLVSPRVRIPE